MKTRLIWGTVAVLALSAACLWGFEVPGLIQVTNPPDSGTFFLLSAESRGDGAAPYPFDPYAGIMPIYQLPGFTNQYLVGDTPEDFQALQTLQSEFGAGHSRSMSVNGIEFPGDGEDGGGVTNSYSGFGPTTNDLWLELDAASLTNGVGTLIIHRPEWLTDGVWDVFATTNLNLDYPWLNGTNWIWVGRTAVGATNIIVPLLSEQQCYFRLGNALIDSDGDGLSDACELLWTHTQTNVADNADIGFTITFPSDLSTSSTISGSLTVTSGFPTHLAVLVNDTNFNNAHWSLMQSPITVDLGTADGPKDI